MEQICFEAPAALAAVVSLVVTVVSGVVNFVPSPEQSKGVMKVISRTLHFIAFDIVTAMKK